MAWNTPPTHSPGDPVSSADFNLYQRDNPNYLLSGRQFVQLAPYVGGADYSKTGAGTNSFGDLDATNLILTLTPSSTRVRVEFQIWASNSTQNIFFDIFCTTLGVRGGDATAGLDNNNFTPATLAKYRVKWIFTGLTPGVSTSFKLQFKQANTSGTVVVRANGVAIIGSAEEM